MLSTCSIRTFLGHFVANEVSHWGAPKLPIVAKKPSTTTKVLSSQWSEPWGGVCGEADISEESALSLNEGKAFSE